MFEEPDTPPEQTPRRIEDAKMIERRITDAVYSRMRDRAYVIDALSVLITDSPMTQATLSNLVMGYDYPYGKFRARAVRRSPI